MQRETTYDPRRSKMLLSAHSKQYVCASDEIVSDNGHKKVILPIEYCGKKLIRRKQASG